MEADKYQEKTLEELYEYNDMYKYYTKLDVEYANREGSHWYSDLTPWTQSGHYDSSIYLDRVTALSNVIKEKKEANNNSGNSLGGTSSGALGGIIQGANSFISSGETASEKMSQTDLMNLSNNMYNILLVLGIVVAVIIGMILGIKFITTGADGKAEVKNALVPYFIGCVVVFGAFTIWKIVVDILQSM